MSNEQAATAPLLDETAGPDVQVAVEKTFNQMFGVQVKATFKQVDKNALPICDVSALINLVSKDPVGVMIVSFPKPTLFALLKEFYNREFTEVDKVAIGAISEITNIIFGVVKFRLGSKGFKLGLAMPQILDGAGLRVPNIAWAYAGEFTSDAGPFNVILVRV